MRQRTQLISDPARERERWKDCTRCPLGHSSFRRVWGEGPIPCDILVVGEAPGNSEDALGRPFVGPCGAVLREALALAGDYRVFLTNMVACVPHFDAEHHTVRFPSQEEILSCAPRLQWICSHSAARRVLLLGKVAADYEESIKRWTPKAAVEIMEHPAFVLRSGPSAKRDWIEKVRRWVNDVD